MLISVSGDPCDERSWKNAQVKLAEVVNADPFSASDAVQPVTPYGQLLTSDTIRPVGTKLMGFAVSSSHGAFMHQHGVVPAPGTFQWSNVQTLRPQPLGPPTSGAGSGSGSGYSPAGMCVQSWFPDRRDQLVCGGLEMRPRNVSPRANDVPSRSHRMWRRFEEQSRLDVISCLWDALIGVYV